MIAICQSKAPCGITRCEENAKVCANLIEFALVILHAHIVVEAVSLKNCVAKFIWRTSEEVNLNGQKGLR